MSDIDVGDYNKSRGFLIGWGALLFCLWFFEADLTKFKLMGNEITLTKNIDDVWLLLGLVAAYLWFRFYQQLPTDAFKFNDEMNEVYDGLLRWWVRIRLYLCVSKRIARKQSEFLNGSSVKVLRVEIKMHHAELSSPESTVVVHELSLTERATMLVKYFTKTTIPDKETVEGWGHGETVTVPSSIAIALKVIAVVKGVFTVSWFTDYIGPLAFGGGMAVLAIHQWTVVNL